MGFKVAYLVRISTQILIETGAKGYLLDSFGSKQVNIEIVEGSKIN